DATAWPSTATILTLATSGGHRVSGLAAAEPRAGTIADGAPADLLVFDDDPLAQLDQGTAEANLVFGSPAHRPRHVIARGRVLMRDSQPHHHRRRRTARSPARVPAGARGMSRSTLLERAGETAPGFESSDGAGHGSRLEPAQELRSHRGPQGHRF